MDGHITLFRTKQTGSEVLTRDPTRPVTTRAVSNSANRLH